MSKCVENDVCACSEDARSADRHDSPACPEFLVMLDAAILNSDSEKVAWIIAETLE